MRVARRAAVSGSVVTRVWPLLAASFLLVMVVTEAAWPPCKSQCDVSFTSDDVILHPGIKSVCHRGCELFTVAFIATPVKNDQQIGTPYGSKGNFDISHEVAKLMGISEEILFNDNKLWANKHRKIALETSSNKQNIETLVRQMEKFEKENNPMEKKYFSPVIVTDTNGKRDFINSAPTDGHNVKTGMEKIQEERRNMKLRFLRMKAKTETAGRQLNSSLTLSKIPKQANESKIQMLTTNSNEVAKNIGDDDCKDLEEIEKLFSSAKAGQEAAQQQNIEIVSHSPNSNNAKVPEKYEEIKISPSINRHSPFPTLTGEPARKILDSMHQLIEQRNVKSTEPKAATKDDKSENSKDLQSANKSPGTYTPPAAHGPIPLADYKNALNNKSPKSSTSKTTVEPLANPVQDHPVQADKHITTDSSNAERKNTTPKTSNVMTVPEKQNSSGILQVVSIIGNKLGWLGKPPLLPFLGISFDRPKPMNLMIPSPVISIVEVIKKKNNIDFEKIHENHMRDVTNCPKTHERMEQAKHSCRNACASVYKEILELDACSVGCQFQEESSTKLVLEKAPVQDFERNIDKQNLVPKQDLSTGGDLLPSKKKDLTKVQPEGLLSTFSIAVANLTSKIGQFIKTQWNHLRTRKIPDNSSTDKILGLDVSELSARADMKPNPQVAHLEVSITKKGGSSGSPTSQALDLMLSDEINRNPLLPNSIFKTDFITDPGLSDNRFVHEATRPRPHLGVQIFFENVFKLPKVAMPQQGKQTRGKTVFQIFDGLPKPPEKIFNEKSDEDKQMLQKELEKGGNILVPFNSKDPISKLRDYMLKKVQMETHLFENLPVRFGERVDQTLQENLFEDMLPLMFEPESYKEHEKSDVITPNLKNENVIESKISLDSLELSTSEDGVLKHNLESVIKRPFVEPRNHESSKGAGASSCETPPELDILGCISRKSGLPRWIIAATIFGSTLVLFYLCFSMSTSAMDFKLKQNTARAFRVCEDFDDDYDDAICCEEKKLLPSEKEILKLRMETV